MVTIDPIVEEIIINLRENGLVWAQYKAKKEKPAPVIEPSLGRSNVSREVTQVLEQLQLQMLTT